MIKGLPPAEDLDDYIDRELTRLSLDTVPRPYNPRARYSEEQRAHIWELLSRYGLRKTFDLCRRKIPLRTLHCWLQKAASGERPERRKGSGRKCACPALDQKLFEWFLAQRARQLPVSNKALGERARVLAKEMGVDGVIKASGGWVQKFRKRHNLNYRLRTRLANKPCSEMHRIISDYFTRLNDIMRTQQPTEVWNFDEVRVYFEPNLTHTVEQDSQKSVSIISVGAMNMRMTVILMISASGKMAPPVLLFYSKGFRPFSVAEYPDACIMSNASGYNIESTHYAMVLPHFMKYVKPGSLLIFDECKAHTSKRIENLIEAQNVKLIHIPGGATSLCQPVDAGIGKKVKGEVKRQYLKWLTENFNEITAPTRRRRKSFRKPDNKLVARWVLAGVKGITPEEIMNAYYYTGVTSPGYQTTILTEKIKRYFVKVVPGEKPCKVKIESELVESELVESAEPESAKPGIQTKTNGEDK